MANQIVSINQCARLGLGLNVPKKGKQGMNKQCQVFSLKSFSDKNCATYHVFVTFFSDDCSKLRPNEIFYP